LTVRDIRALPAKIKRTRRPPPGGDVRACR
jgi:hypothetical protein